MKNYDDLIKLLTTVRTEYVFNVEQLDKTGNICILKNKDHAFLLTHPENMALHLAAKRIKYDRFEHSKEVESTMTFIPYE